MTGWLVASTLAWILLEASAASPEPARPWSRDQAGALATGVVLLAVQLSAIVEHHLARRASHPAGLLLIAAGIGLRVGAIRALGRDFVSVTVAPAALRRAGLYRWLWHPSELGLLAAAAGAAVLMRSAYAAALTALVLVPLSVLRARAEDRALAALRARP